MSARRWVKTFQRLGYFVTSDHIPDAFIAHLAEIEKIPVNQGALKHYDITIHITHGFY